MATTFFVNNLASSLLIGGITAGSLSAGRGSGVQSAQVSTVTGPTAGVPIAISGNTLFFAFRVAAVTISGTITYNVWMSESNMSANVGPQMKVEQYDNSGTFVSTISNKESGVEVAVTTRAANNFTDAAPTSTNVSDGNWIVVSIWGNDVGTMASGFTFNASWSGTSGAADGDTFVTFTETITAYTPPAAGQPTDQIILDVYPQLLAQ